MTFTCNTCMLQFEAPDAQRDHMRTDWHRYNLKRRVASLPPITQHVFETKVQALANKPSDPIAEKKLNKKLKKQQRLEEREKENEKLTEEEIIEKQIQKKLSKGVELSATSCLFCKKTFPAVDKTSDHMFNQHGLYIPEKKYLVDLEGLLKYLGEKISIGNMCLACNFEGRSMEAVRAHMQSKRHCRIPYESMDAKMEIADFYDFTSSYDVEADADADVNEEVWEDLSEDEDEDETNPSDTDDADVDVDGDYEDAYIDASGLELTLPSGYKLGHRSMAKYYKQSLKPEVVPKESALTVAASENRRMVTTVDAQQQRAQKLVWKEMTKQQNIERKREAKFINAQRHYRDELLQ